MSDPTRAPGRTDDRESFGRHAAKTGAWTLLDVAFLGIGVTAGWFTSGELLFGAWAQAAAPLLATPLVLAMAGFRAPSAPEVRAGKPMKINDRPVHGRPAAFASAGFFTVHFGIFTLVLGVFAFLFSSRAGLGSLGDTAMVWLLVRAVAANVPTALADWRFISADGFSQLARRATAVMGRPYPRIIPLHLGVIGLGQLQVRGAFGGVGGVGVDPEIVIVAVVVLMTAAGSLWRYPSLEPVEPTNR